MAYEIKQAARQRRLELIRIRIAAGSYNVSTSDVADSILRCLVEESAAREAVSSRNKRRAA